MTKVFAVAITFFLVALANMTCALAQESCEPIRFPDGKDSTVLSGSAQSEEIVCYRLDAQIGQKFDLSVLQSDDIAITIIDVEDMQDRIRFTAQQTSYQVNVYQMFRSAGPEKYRISVKRSGTKPHVEGATEEPWQMRISLDMKRLTATQPAKDGNGRLVLTCNKDIGGGVGLSFDGYQGEALGRHDDTEYATKVVITGSRAKTRTFDLRMHYFEPDRSWVSSGNAPAGFLRAFGGGFLLTLKNGDGAEIATFDLHGSSKFSKAALVRCGDAPKSATATTAAKSGEGISEAEATPSAAGPMGGAGQPFRDCEHCPEMVPVPPGTFMMGASQKEKRQLKYVDWELPRHQVSIAYPFAIGRFEVTVEEFDAFVKETGVPVGGKCTIRTMESGPLAFKYTGTPVPGGDKTGSAPYIIYIADGSYAQPGLPVTPRQPATCVSRNEIKQYLAWLSRKSGRHYRLPSEAEWEYAYRAGTDTINFWGDDFRKTCDYANFADRKSGYQAAPAASCAEKIHPGWAAEVGSYKPNPWGLYDMVGNVQETVEDCLHESYEGAPTDGSPWTKKDCVVFVARGGDYEHTQYSMRAAGRLLFGYVENGADGMWTREESSDERFNLMGFRVAVSLDGTSWDEMAQTPASEKKTELKDEVAPSPPATESGLRYGYLPAAVKKYADEVRNRCKENDPNGVPANKMSGIRPIALADGTPAFVIENETLCSDHYSGANCSNRGCDVVVMTDGGDGWKEIFHEHLYDDAFDIGDGDKLKSITASIYAGDPHCDPDPNATFESSDSCDVVISYENKNWVWKKAGTTKGAASKDAVVDASSSAEAGRGGS